MYVMKDDEIVRIAAWLLENGCLIELKDSNGKTALEIAKEKKNTSLIEFLVNRQIVLMKSEEITKQSLTSAMANLSMSFDQKKVTRRISYRGFLRDQLNDLGKTRNDPQSLLQGMKAKGFSYLQINLERLANAPGK